MDFFSTEIALHRYKNLSFLNLLIRSHNSLKFKRFDIWDNFLELFSQIVPFYTCMIWKFDFAMKKKIKSESIHNYHFHKKKNNFSEGELKSKFGKKNFAVNKQHKM